MSEENNFKLSVTKDLRLIYDKHELLRSGFRLLCLIGGMHAVVTLVLICKVFGII